MFDGRPSGISISPSPGGLIPDSDPVAPLAAGMSRSRLDSPLDCARPDRRRRRVDAKGQDGLILGRWIDPLASPRSVPSGRQDYPRMLRTPPPSPPNGKNTPPTP